MSKSPIHEAFGLFCHWDVGRHADRDSFMSGLPGQFAHTGVSLKSLQNRLKIVCREVRVKSLICREAQTRVICWRRRCEI